MRSFLAPVLALLLASPPAGAKAKRDPANDAYESARHSYYVLKDDAQRRKFRHNWLNVAEKFEGVATKYPKSTRAADALYTAAELRSDLSRISMLEEDLKAAIADYEQLIQKYPKSNLSDDASLALARIHLDRTGDSEAARKVLNRALHELPRGDVRSKLVALQTTLPSKPEPRATGKRIAARTEERRSEKKDARDEAPQKDTPAPKAIAESKQDPQPTGTTDAHESPVDNPQSDPLALAFARATAGKTSTAASPSGANAAPGSTSSPTRAEDAKSSSSPAPSNATASAGSSGTGTASAATASTTPGPSRDPASAGKLTVADLPTPRAGDDAQASREVDLSGVNAKEAKARLKAAVKSGGEEYTLAEQLGLKVRRVVIDAGHGGHDTGAIGKKGTREKDITLAIAKRVGEILADRGLEVILTRDDDTFVRLEDRTRIANEAKGDLFISIHCNAAENRKAHGIETFTLNVAADRYSIRLAARENASSEKSISDLQFILADLATKANTEESQRLASRVQKSLVSGLKTARYSAIRDLGTKQALFYVLLGAKMPAILVETSFISHLEEEKRLSSKGYQEHVAQSIADGVQGFLEDRDRLARVD